MKKSLLSVFLLCCLSSCKEGDILARVKHITRVKIIESNNVTTRPGSVYDNITYFESRFSLDKPKFFYEFIDTGLGSAEPLYPMYQAGWQGDWAQLIPAFFSEKERHIDHFTSLPTPEGCQVDSVYMLRGIHEFPKTMYQKEREEGYDLIVIRLEHYTKLYAEASCGRHRANDPDPNFDPMEYLKKNLKAKSFADFKDKEKLSRFEAKVSAIRHLEEKFIKGDEMPLFDPENLEKNSLWYYPEGHAFDFGVNQSFPQTHAPEVDQAQDLVFQLNSKTRDRFSFKKVVSSTNFDLMLKFLQGRPYPDFRSDKEPGQDTLRLEDVTSRHLYTSGIDFRPIENVYADVSNQENFTLVGMVVHPYEWEEDILFNSPELIPQVRLVYQMKDPQDPSRHVEQLYFHLNFDGVDRLASPELKAFQYREFLKKLNRLAELKQSGAYQEELELFMQEMTAGPLENFAFSSTLTGIWVFGALTNTNNQERELRPLRIKREGIDYGYYSSTYDFDLLRAEIKSSRGERKAKLKILLNDLTVNHYRDDKREDVHAIRFDRMTCAQCHQTSGRDGVHLSLNDSIDPKYTGPVRGTKYLFKELERQLEEAQ